MIKFYKYKECPEIRKCALVDDDGKYVKALAIIGQVKYLLSENIIFDNNTNGNENKWLVIENNEENTIREYESLDECKTFCRNYF